MKASMNDVNAEYDRFKNVLNLQKQLQKQYMSMSFSEYDLKRIVYLLGELKQYREANR